MAKFEIVMLELIEPKTPTAGVFRCTVAIQDNEEMWLERHEMTLSYRKAKEMSPKYIADIV